MTYISQHTYRRTDPERSVRQLNSLLRGELAAVETYKMAIEKVRDSAEADAENVALLEKIEREHERAAEKLRERVRAGGGDPAEAAPSAEAWAGYSAVVRSADHLLGDTAALRSLKMGEELGLKDYREALDDVDESSRQLIQHRLIPAEQQHIAVIDRLMMAIGRA